MTILHYIPKIDNSSLPCTFIAEMAEGGMEGVSSHIVTADAGDGVGQYAGLIVHKASPCGQLTFGGRRIFEEIMDEIKPDVVHIHSFWGLSSWLVFKWAEKRRLPIVVSPYKSLMDWNFRHNYLSSKLPQLAFAQHYMLRHASAIHAVTRQELETLKTLSWYPGLRGGKSWNDRLCLITEARANESGEQDVRRLSSEVKDLYRKVVDSNPFLVMSDADRDVENLLLAYGASLQLNVMSSNIYLDIENIKEKFAALTSEDWRRILLHSADQGILQPVTMAAKALDPEKAGIDVANVDRFCKQIEQPFLESATPRIKVARMHQLKNDYNRYETETKLCVMLLNTKYLLSEGKLSRRNFADLYTALRFSDYNDYILENMLDEIGMRKFASRILYVLHTSMSLEKGYMPFGMTCDRKTKNIMRKLFKSNIQ